MNSKIAHPGLGLSLDSTAVEQFALECGKEGLSTVTPVCITSPIRGVRWRGWALAKAPGIARLGDRLR